MAALSPAAPTRPIDATGPWPSSAWTNSRPRTCASFGLDHSARHVAAPVDRVDERGDRESGLHFRVDRVAHHSVRIHALDRAEFALSSPVLIGHYAQVVAGRRPRFFALPRLGLPKADHQPSPSRSAMRSAQPCPGPPPSPRRRDRVAELRAVPMCVEQRVRAVGLLYLGVGDRVREPAAVGLASDLEDPGTSPSWRSRRRPAPTSRYIIFPAGWPARGRPPRGGGPRSLAQGVSCNA